jgi:chromosomal replication initiation ATPase DnaA
LSAEAIDDVSPPPAGPVLLEDADRRDGDRWLFNLIDRVDADDPLLLTARLPPRLWPASLPDLRSRLNALDVVEIGPPDDGVLEGILRKLFRDRHIRPDGDLLAYLLRRMERSAPAAADLVDRLDQAADAAGRSVNRALARDVLETGDSSGDLFP